MVYKPLTHQKTRQELAAAIENLYMVFSAYPLSEVIHGCPCCVHDEDHQNLRSAPLRELTLPALRRYSEKAMTTWGDVDDFRHFLPRLLELVPENPLLFVEEILFGKLNYGKWWTWSESEQKAIDRYLQALWAKTLASKIPYEHSYTEEYLCCIGMLVDDISPYLEMWQADQRARSRRHLANFAWENGEAIANGELNDAFWHGAEDNMKKVVAWLKEQQIDVWEP